MRIEKGEGMCFGFMGECSAESKNNFLRALRPKLCSTCSSQSTNTGQALSLFTPKKKREYILLGLFCCFYFITSYIPLDMSCIFKIHNFNVNYQIKLFKQI